MLPLLEAEAVAIERGDLVEAAEALLRLALPVTYTWLLGFYLFFHVRQRTPRVAHATPSHTYT